MPPSATAGFQTVDMQTNAACLAVFGASRETWTVREAFHSIDFFFFLYLTYSAENPDIATFYFPED